MQPNEKFDPSQGSLDLHNPTGIATAAEDLACEHFAAWPDVELDKLVAKWSHMAAPNAVKSKARFDRPYSI